MAKQDEPKMALIEKVRAKRKKIVPTQPPFDKVQISNDYILKKKISCNMKTN